MEKSPAYQRYPKQILGDDKVLAMDWDAYGMHEWLMSLSWQQEPRGTIPSDITLMRRWLRLPPNAVPCSNTDHRCPCADHVWRRVLPQLRTAWVECGELTDTDPKTGNEIFPASIRGLGSSRLANRGMVRTSIKAQNYSNGNKQPKGVVKTQMTTQTPTQIAHEHLEDVDEDHSSVDVVPKKTEVVGLEVKLESFDAENFVARLRELYVNRGTRDGRVPMAAFEAVEQVAKQREWRRSEAANYVLERTERAAESFRKFRPPDKWPMLYTFLHDHKYDDDPRTWEVRDERRSFKQGQIDDAFAESERRDAERFSQPHSQDAQGHD